MFAKYLMEWGIRPACTGIPAMYNVLRYSLHVHSKVLFSKGILIYVTYVTVSVGQIFDQTILICSIDIQQADSMKKLSKMIKYCQFCVAENTRS